MKHSFKYSNLQLIGLLLSALVLFSSCSKLERKAAVPYSYLLLLDIKDALGVDILKDIPIINTGGYMVIEDKNGWTAEVKPDLYKLKIIVPELCFKPESPLTERTDYPLWINKISDSYYLSFSATSSSLCPPADVITFKLTCPYIFGDSKEHIITSHWSPDGLYLPSTDNQEGAKSDAFFPRNECSHIAIDGKEWLVEQEIFAPNFSDETKQEIAKSNIKKDFSRLISVARIVLDN